VLKVGAASPARVQRLGQAGDSPSTPDAPDQPGRGVPIGRVMCGYRSCSADVANVWPAVPVAPEEAASASTRPTPACSRNWMPA
jgi:hypothetical protein